MERNFPNSLRFGHWWKFSKKPLYPFFFPSCIESSIKVLLHSLNSVIPELSHMIKNEDEKRTEVVF